MSEIISIENPQGCAHDWEDATSMQSRRRARSCVRCGKREEYGGFISERERADAVLEMTIVRAKKMAGEPGYFEDGDGEECP